MEELEINRLGGVTPGTEAEMRRAKAVDLITLPKSIPGTNCASCLFIRDVEIADDLIVGFCAHKAVRQPVSSRQCCVFYDVKGAIRPWEK